MQPSQIPTISSQPSVAPSNPPTAEPTNYEVSSTEANFLTQVLSTKKMNETEEVKFCDVLETYTVYFLNGTSRLDRVTTTCTVTNQLIGNFDKRRLRRREMLDNDKKRSLSDKINFVSYVMRYDSLFTDVANYTSNFKTFI